MDEASGVDATDVQQVARLLGGGGALGCTPRTRLDVHELLLRGLPATALTSLVDGLVVLDTGSLEKAVGMSLRTFQRRKDAPSSPLSRAQSGRTWKFAEILAHAIAVFGSRQEAEMWLERPATGLDQRRPLDLLATPAGMDLVADFLTRLEYGVYA